ncbi:hypothetical protein SMMN14_05628, partial [Sphaerulina musiva]
MTDEERTSTYKPQQQAQTGFQGTLQRPYNPSPNVTASTRQASATTTLPIDTYNDWKLSVADRPLR